MFDFIYKAVGWLLAQSYNLTNHYALALLLFSLVVQLLLFPLGIKQQKNSVLQANLRPKELAIRKKYKGRNDRVTQEKMTREIQEMQTEEGFNPMSGCLPLLVQLPVIIILYNVIQRPLSYILNFSTETIDALKLIVATAKHGAEEATKFLNSVFETDIIKYVIGNVDNPEVVKALENSGGVDGIVEFSKGFSFFGNTTLLDSPNFSVFNWLLIIPVLIYVTSLLASLISKKYMVTQEGMQNNPMTGPMMTYGMPFITVIFSFSLSASIGLYWIYRSIYQVAQTFVLNKMYPIPEVTREQIALAEEAYKKKKKKKKVITIEVDEDDDSFDEMIVSKERAEKIEAKNKKLEEEESEVDKKLEELMEKANKNNNDNK